MNHVNIEKYKEEGARIFTDRDRGIKARKDLELDKLEKDGNITILLPEDTWGVNPSFFGGMFETSIKTMQSDFYQNYSFKYSNGTEISDSLKRNIEDDIEYVMRGLTDLDVSTVLNIISYVSNAIVAICAVITILVTVRNFKTDRKEQKRENQRLKLSDLYKQSVIDSVLKIQEELINHMNSELYAMSIHGVDEPKMKALTEYLTTQINNCFREVEIVKLFDKQLYNDTKQITEQISDAYGRIINDSMAHNFISHYFERNIKELWNKQKFNIYNYYINSNFMNG